MDPYFAAMYQDHGRPSIPPEQLLRALLLQVLYSIPSERRLIEQIDYNLLFRWFVGLGIDAAVWHSTTFTKNRDRWLEYGIADRFFESIRQQAEAARLVSRQHFSVDGTLIEASASLKSFKKKDRDTSDKDPGGSGGGRNRHANFRGEKRKNDTHASTTDPDSRLMRKSNGQEAKLVYGGHVMMENRNGLIVETEVTHAGTRAERDAALVMVDRYGRGSQRTLGCDRGYDAKEFIEDLRERQVTPHVAPKATSRLDERTFRHEGYWISQQIRYRIEECFGWMKTVGLLRKLRHRGLAKVGWIFRFTAAAYNLVRMRGLLEAA
jgi:transposase